MPHKRHRLSFQTYDVVPTWAYIAYCRRSRAAHVIQSSYKNYARRRDERAANTIFRFFARYVDGWRII